MAKELFKSIREQFSGKPTEMSYMEYLKLCKNDSIVYANAPERLLKAIGEPKIVDTSKDQRLSRIFLNKTMRIYPAFEHFYGVEDVVERIVNFLIHAAQGLEESKQVLYLLGPVGAAKSSLAERLKALMEVYPIYTLKYKDEISPVFESPLALLNPDEVGDQIEAEYGIPKRKMGGVISPWCMKRLEQSGGDVDAFSVVRLQPSRIRQIGIMKTEPGDDNNQDISTLVGKVDIRKLERYSQNDPDAYSYSGGMNRTTQGLLEFVEMFKAPIKMLHPLLTATQERNYVGTENIGALPFHGMILAHSNQTEWETFKNSKNNEAFLDRVYLIKVPYCLRVDEERMIYSKLIENSDLKGKPCAPGTLDMLAKWSILTRLVPHENSNLYSKMRAYNGDSLKESDPKAKPVNEYREAAGVNEGMNGSSTRFAFKILSSVFNFSADEIAADPVHLMYVLEMAIKREQFPKDTESKYIDFIKTYLAPRYAEDLGNEIQKSYLESYSEYGQNLFDRYLSWADAWVDDTEFKDPDTGQLFDREQLDRELSKTEKPANIVNPKDFRGEIVKFALRYKAKNGGVNPPWNSYEKIREVIEKRMFSNVSDLMPVISFDSKRDSKTQEKHDDFLGRMKSRGYTEKQTRRLVEWYMRKNQSS